jgi:D-arabinan exo alpha-(1,3)/(1,5)-arabinofuranosidase (non-reducing end)
MSVRLDAPGGLAMLPYRTGIITRQISPENPLGGKGAACRATPDPANPDLPHSAAALDLGRGWKVRPFIGLAAGSTAVLADIEGPGTISYLWLTSDLADHRALILRAYWDDEAAPSVEAPLGDFFAAGHSAAPHTVTSIPIVVGPSRGYSSYWPMPFRSHARLTLTNTAGEDARIVTYKVLYHLVDVGDDAAYFHAQWRSGRVPLDRPEHIVVDGIRGSGSYVGTSIAWAARSGGWWGEGEVKFFIDGDGEFPTIADTGTEDYFGGAWGFGFDAAVHAPGDITGERSFSAPYVGCPLAGVTTREGYRRYSLYRWHIPDAIGFERDLRVTIQSLGWNAAGDRYRPRDDDVASVAYWYQREPHAPFPIDDPSAAPRSG